MRITEEETAERERKAREEGQEKEKREKERQDKERQSHPAQPNPVILPTLNAAEDFPTHNPETTPAEPIQRSVSSVTIRVKSSLRPGIGCIAYHGLIVPDVPPSARISSRQQRTMVPNHIAKRHRIHPLRTLRKMRGEGGTSLLSITGLSQDRNRQPRPPWQGVYPAPQCRDRSRPWSQSEAEQ